MGRLQAFDTTTAVQAARDLFWDQGFEATSLADLELATGLNRSSLYHAFSSKRGLFDAAAQDYLDTVIRPRLAGLTATGDTAAGGTTADRDPAAEAAAALVEYFDSLARAVAALPTGSARRGCLLVNATAGLAAHDDAARVVVDGYRVELMAALRGALVSATPARAADLLDADARVLASLSISAMVLARINTTEAVALLASAVEMVGQLTGAASTG
ncbi:transcriptional regulator, TetR family [Sanguibacter gelidistatuariae]|uniref:Transcriptional regulator, TetR family n=1 Tax=Sanguibacter gelidistatuariae TaxID=1814289 RepID=A0A1G6MNY4_9MICO|nr:helix-turn-helix domain-containing protein [Sanguibacter gelidistatuariae]SDC57212.1 transcriptional regulator, TetR family [Sanguibacter gelidistatuariae]